MRSHSLIATTIDFAGASLMLLVAAAPVAAAIIDWDGNQSVDGNLDGTFAVTNNWNPDQIPVGVDAANFNADAIYTVTLDGNVATGEIRVVDGHVTFLSDTLTVRTYNVITGNMDANVSGGELTIGSADNPVVVNVGDIMNIGSNASGTNRVTVSGAGSELNAGSATHSVGRNGRSGQLLITDNAAVSYGGTLRIGVDNNSVGLASVDAGGLLSTGSIEVATVGSNGSGTLQVSDAGSSINQNVAGATLTVGSAAGKPGTINVRSNGVFSTGTGMTTINASGMANVGSGGGDGGTLNVRGDLLIDGGTVQVLSNGSELNLAAGTTVTVENGGQWMIHFDDKFFDVTQANSIYLDEEGAVLDFTGRRFRLQGDSTMSVTGGADALIHTNFDIGNDFGDGTLLVSGPGSSVVADPNNQPMWWGRHEYNSTVTFTDEAVGSFLGGVEMMNSSPGSSSTGIATTTVSGGAQVTFGQFDLAATGGLSTGEATLAVTGGDSKVSIDGASGLNVGKAEGGSAHIQVSDEAVFQMGTGETLVGATGSITVADATFNADGNVNLVGGSMTASTGSIVSVDGQFVLSSLGTLTIDGGGGAAVNANAGLDASDGNLDLRRGSLRVTGGELALDPSLSSYDVNGVGGTANLRLGEGATANLSRPLHVAVDSGFSTLTIADGGSLASLSGRVGIEAGSTGSTTISGTDSMGSPSMWTITGGVLNIGEEGSGFLTIEEGAHVSSGSASVGTVAVFGSGGGRVSVSGTDVTGNPSSWSSSSTLQIGSFGDGRLTIEDGGHVSSVSGFIGTATSGEGTVIVRGTGQSDVPSQWVISDFLAVGGFGTGELEILDGGKVVNFNAFIGASALGNGRVTVSGSGSNWTSLEELAVGGDNLIPRGSGHLLIADDGLVQVDGVLRIWPFGTVMLDGGTLKIDSNAVVVFGTGNLNYLSGTFHLTDAGGYTVGANSGPIDQVLGYEHVSIPNGGGLIVDAVLSVPSSTSITVNAGSVAADAIINSELVIATNSTLSTTNGLSNNAGLVLVDSTVEGPVFNFEDSTVTVLGTVEFNGVVSGTGNFFGPGTANFNADLAIGASPAEVTFEGDVALGASNTLFIELGGLSAGEEYDQLRIDGSAMLGGTLDVERIDLFTPEYGDLFDIVTATEGFGGSEFITLELPVLAGGLDWNVSYGATAVSLTVILAGDFDFDSDVDGQDFLVWQRDPSVGTLSNWQANYGKKAPLAVATAPVPEPRSLVLFVVVAFLACVQRMRNAPQ